jgi:RNA-directed DNA polymerase
LRKHPLLSSTKAKLLQKQQGKCRWCELLFQDGDAIEIDHLTPKNHGGGEELCNKLALHGHCHDARHTRRDLGTSDKGSVLEEPYEAKVSRTVLKPSDGGDPIA